MNIPAALAAMGLVLIGAPHAWIAVLILFAPYMLWGLRAAFIDFELVQWEWDE